MEPVDTGQGVAWDLSSYFPEFNGPAMQAFKKDLKEEIDALTGKAGRTPDLDAATADAWERLVLGMEEAGSRLGHLSSYVACLEAAHTEREEYALERAVLAELAAGLAKLKVEVERAFKAADENEFERFLARPELAGIAHPLRRMREWSLYTMSPAEEGLAADLNVYGLHAWGRLYDKVSGRLVFEMETPDGKTERLPISKWRSLMSDVDREVGRRAFEGGNRAWQGIEDVCASAINAIAGTRLLLNRRRGVPHFLDVALFQAAITRETLTAMYRAIHDHLDLAREIFRVKADFMGRKGIWFYEREAPLPLPGVGTFAWPEAVRLVHTAFEKVYPDLAAYFKRLSENRWIESQPRPAKRQGAFCTRSTRTREQRIFMTYNGTLGDITTLAHETGHAWHGHLMRDLRPMAQQYPMTLAETASVFAEQLLADGIYGAPSLDDTQKLHMLDANLSEGAVMLMDITVRFEFEQAFYEWRADGEVPPVRLKALMEETQQRIFGDVLLPEGTDPYFWASKLHFYITGLSFYNFPYTFGFLLARRLAARLREEGAPFLPRYENFLRLAGSGAVEAVIADTLGMDVTDPAFWIRAIETLKEPLARYRTLLEQR